MKITVFTITCNRIEETKKYISSLSKKTDINFNHIIIDNGSTDGTPELLQKLGYEVIKLDRNIGIIGAFKIAIRYILDVHKPDLIIKYDNDCEVITGNILEKIVDFYSKGCKCMVLGPLDINIPEHLKPRILYEQNQRGYNVRCCTHVGGIFKVMPIEAAKLLLNEPDEILNGDLKRGRFWLGKGIESMYLTDLLIDHKGIPNQTKNYKL